MGQIRREGREQKDKRFLISAKSADGIFSSAISFFMLVEMIVEFHQAEIEVLKCQRPAKSSETRLIV